MKLTKIKLINFRGYKASTEIVFNDLTVFVGRNDVGKSTILEALDLFFNDGKGVIKFDKGDINVASDSKEYMIEATFTELPEKIIVDSTYQTTLKGEYLLNEQEELEIVKKFNGSKCSGTFIRAYHPTNPDCNDLLQKKIADLRKIIKTQSIICENQSANAIMRKSIWNHYTNNLQLKTVEIDVTSGEDTKKIWSKLSSFLPVYSLFQSDRQNTDGDKEVQDPLKAAVAQFFQDTELQNKLNEVAVQVEARLKDVSERTLAKLREMDPEVANTLKPVIPPAASLKWADVFKNVSISSDEDIPINKRGSGIKRLVLLNFFRAEAERRQSQGESTGLIYAIEEPETSQHFSNQKILAEALIVLSKAKNTQVILTTHSGIIVKMLQFKDLRLVENKNEGNRCIKPVQSNLLIYPSLNEINFTAFGEVTEEYHDELYGLIMRNQWMNEYESGKEKRTYIKEFLDHKTGSLTKKTYQYTLTHYIRDVLHHPENTSNEKYTYEELNKSVEDMRSFLESKRNGKTVWMNDIDDECSLD